MAFSFKASITIDHTKVQSTDQTDFPILVSGTYAGAAGVPDLRVTGSGGRVQNSNGYDIYFYSDSALTTRLPAEREKYVSTTGEIVFWVKKTVLTATDVVIYIAYGDSGISTDPNSDATYGKTSVWDSNYKAVWHLPDGSSLSGADSTSNARTMTGVNSPTAGVGTVDGAGVFNGSNQYMNTSAFSLSASPSVASFSAWTKTSSDLNNVRNTIFSTTPNNTAANWSIELSPQSPPGTRNYSVNVIYPGVFQFATPVNSYPTGGGWHHISFSRNGAGTSAIIYIDGVSQTVTSADTNGWTDSSEAKNIGARTSNQYFNGSLDEIRYSNSVRSADWVKTEYNSQSSPSTFYTMGVETLLLNVFDSITVTESIGVTTVFTLSVSESITITESIGVIVDFNIFILDTITLTESIIILDINFINVFDSTTVTEDVTILNINFVNIYDSATISEDIGILEISFINISDSLTISEAITIDISGLSIFIDVNDSLTISEAITIDIIATITNVISVNDLITISEFVSGITVFVVSVTDSITSTESLSLRIFYPYTTGEVYQFFEGLTDDGAPISFNIETNNNAMVNFETIVEPRIIMAEVKEGNNIGVFVAYDDGSFKQINGVSLKRGFTRILLDVDPLTQDYPRCRVMKIALREFSGSRCTISRMAIQYYETHDQEDSR